MSSVESLEGTVFDSRLDALDAETAVLLDRCAALLASFKAYSLSATPAAPRGPLSALGVAGLLGGLAALAGDRTEAAPATPEAVLATSLEALGADGDGSEPSAHEGLADALAASLGAPLLAPLAAGLRAAGSHRIKHAARLQELAVAPLNALVTESLRGVEAARFAYARRCRDADSARDAYLRLGAGADPTLRAELAENAAEAALARDTARASLAAAACHAEGARRHAVITASCGLLSAMRENAAAVLAEVAALQPALDAASSYAAQAKVQAEQRAAAQGQTITEYLAKCHSECAAAKEAAAANAFGERRRAAPNEGVSAGSAALRQSMADAAGAAAAAVAEGLPPPSAPPLKEGWLMLRAAGSWHKRYFVLDARGALAYDRSRAGAVAAARAKVAAIGGKSASRSPAIQELDTGEHEEALGDDAGAEDDPEDDAAALARAVGSMWSLGSTLLRGAASAAVSQARAMAETAGELVRAPGSGALVLLTAAIKLGPPDGDNALATLPFVFRVLAPHAASSLTLQAESAAERGAWVAALQGAVAELLSGAGTAGRPTPAWAALRAAPGNGACADCGAPDPDWASLNLMVLLCQQCAGSHRRLGASASAVRSLNLDEDAWTPSVCALFAAHGNAAANAVWAAQPDEESELRCDAPMETRLEVVRAKYIERAFVDPASFADAAVPGSLASAAAEGDLARLLALLAAGAPPDGHGPPARLPLAAATAGGHLLCVQALLLAGADACREEGGLSLAELALDAPGDDTEALKALLSTSASRRAHGRALAGRGTVDAESVSGSAAEAEPEAASLPESAVAEETPTPPPEPAMEEKSAGPPEPAPPPETAGVEETPAPQLLTPEPDVTPPAREPLPLTPAPVRPAIKSTPPPAKAAPPARTPARTPTGEELDADGWLDDAAPPETTPGGSVMPPDEDDDWA